MCADCLAVVQELAVWLVPETGVAGQAVMKGFGGWNMHLSQGDYALLSLVLRVLFTFCSHTLTQLCADSFAVR